MTPGQNTKIARRLSKLGYRWRGIKREQQKRAVVVVCATAEPSYTNENPPLSVCSTSEQAAVDGLLAAVKAVRA